MEPNIRLRNLFLFTLLALAVVYAYFFLLLPQSWSLNDDYGQLQRWGLAKANPIKAGLEFFKWQLSEGRFLPIDTLTRPFRFRLLPLYPVVFRLVQMVFGALALYGLTLVCRALRYTAMQTAFVLVLVLANQAFKDWITLTASAEVLGTLFFIWSLAFYLRGIRWLGVFLFVLAICSKESFVALAGCYPVIEYFNYRQTAKKSLAPALVIMSMAIVFVIFVATLPRIYTGHGHLLSLSVKNLLAAFIVPPLRSFAPAFILIALAILYFGKEKARDLFMCEGVAIGIFIIFPTTLLLCLWLPFSSWYYLHAVIPWGWSIALGALLPAGADTLEWHRGPGTAVLGTALVTCAFFVVSVLNGSYNRWRYFDDARIAASLACDDFRGHTETRFFSNCDEPAAELQTYLKIYDSRCPQPPQIAHVQGKIPSDVKGPREALINVKWCGPFDLSTVPQGAEVHLGSWTLYREFQ